MEDNKSQQKPSSIPSSFVQNMFSDLNKELNNINLNSNQSQSQSQPQPQTQKPIESNVNNTNQLNQNTINIDDWGAFSGNNGSLEGNNSQKNNKYSNNIKVDPNLFNVF